MMHIRTIVNIDGFLWVSEDVWRDATFACDNNKTGWRRVPVSAEHELCRLLGDMAPMFDGENSRLDHILEFDLEKWGA